jgi:hypothetical protein
MTNKVTLNDLKMAEHLSEEKLRKNRGHFFSTKY